MVAVESSGTLTVVFTDLVGSTDLMSRLGEVVFDRLRSEHFSRLGAVVVAHGGREVKTTGDGLLATFGSTVEALACAVDVQRATHAHGREAGVPLTTRVGVSAGEVTFESGDVFGLPVVEAARLVAAARPGQILASAVVAILAGTRAPAPVSQLGPIQLKGLPEPLQVCTVSWEPATEAASAPLPALLAGAGSLFVARHRERERLSQLWKEAVAGERRLALVSGEPGIGKTHLATHLAATVHHSGGVVLAGRCDEDLGVPYQPFVESLRGYALHVTPPKLGRHAGELTRLVPDLVDLVPGLPAPMQSDAETERYRLFDAVAAWLAEVSAEQPVMLILDDLHWAAKPTLLLLRHMLHFAEPLRVLIVVTYRDTDIGRGHPLSDLLADLRRETGVERMALSGLSASEVLDYLEVAGGHALADEEGIAFARTVHDETDGNPFFLREVLRHLTETGGIAQRGGRWSTTVDPDELMIPEGVRDVVGRRLSRLSETANRVLADAAVIGVEFDLGLLAPVCGLDDDDLLAALEEAEASRLVAEVPSAPLRYRFAHTLVRATLYDELSAGRRVRLHRRVAETIESVHAGRLADHLPALAHHYGRAASPVAETSKAVGYATRAGARALEQLAHHEAVTWYQRALDLLDAGRPLDDGVRLEILLALGDAQHRAGDPTHRDSLLEAAGLAERRGDTGALVRAALTNTRGVIFNAALEVDAQRVAVLESALRALGDEPTPERARLLAQLGLELAWAPDRARRVRCSDEALAIARSRSDPVLLAGVLLPRFYSTWSPATLPARLAETAELLDLSEGLKDPVMRFQAAWLRFRAALEAGDAGEARRSQQITAELAADLGRPLFRWLAGWPAAGVAHLEGRLGSTLDIVESTFETGTAMGLGDAELVALTQKASVAITGENVPRVEEPSTRALASTGNPQYRCYLALYHSQEGRKDEARAIVAPLAHSGFSAFREDVSYMVALAAAAQTVSNLGDAVAAEHLIRLLSPYANQVVVAASMPSGSVSHYLGLLATTLDDHDRAEECFAAAARTHEAMGAPAFLARTRVEWAAMLLTRGREGDLDRGRALLDQAEPVAAELGLLRLSRRIETLRSTPNRR